VLMLGKELVAFRGAESGKVGARGTQSWPTSGGSVAWETRRHGVTGRDMRRFNAASVLALCHSFRSASSTHIAHTWVHTSGRVDASSVMRCRQGRAYCANVNTALRVPPSLDDAVLYSLLDSARFTTGRLRPMVRRRFRTALLRLPLAVPTATPFASTTA
jgi:hypothetical protein